MSDIKRKFLVFNGSKEIAISTNVIKEYENKVGKLSDQTISYFIVTLELDENMPVEELEEKIESAMVEDINDSTIVKNILSDKKNSEELFNA